jgi:hypothetical protein
MAHTAVYGIYGSRQDAEMAIDSMRSAGFRATDISVLFPENEGTKDIGHEKHTKAPEKQQRRSGRRWRRCGTRVAGRYRRAGDPGDWARSWRLDRSWRLWRAWEQGVWLAA